jgi:autotransporter-associated beta strand protein
MNTAPLVIACSQNDSDAPSRTQSMPVRWLAAMAAVLALGATQTAWAASRTWSPTAGSSNTNNAANWDTIPVSADTWVFGTSLTTTLNNDFSGFTVGGLTFNSGASAYTIGGNAFTLNKAIANNSGVTQTINNTVTWSIAGSATVDAISGTGDVVFNGAVTSSVAGGPTFLFNNTLTNFAGGFGMTTGAGQRTNTFGGAGNVSITGLSNGNGTNTGNILNWSNTGTMTLNGVSMTGFVNVNAGTAVLTGDYTSTSNATVTVGSGATPVTSVTTPVGINTGNATLRIVGNRSIGTAGVSNGSLTIRGGNTGGTPIGQGTLSLVDSSINTLTINNATAGATLLTMAGAAGQSSVLKLEIGNNTADKITLANGGKASIGAGGVVVDVTGIGGFTTEASTQSLTLLSAPGAGLSTGGTQFSTGNLTGNFGGYTTASFINTTTTDLILTLGGYTAAPTTGFWKGGINGIWSTLTGGLSNNSNWTTDAGGTTDAHQVVGATSDVVFAASSPGTTTTTLGQNFSIKSLTINTDTSISGNTLTVGNTSTGITVNSGATGTINSTLTGGGAGITKNGVGALVLGGNNTYTGGLTINDGTVRVANAGALNSSTPQAVTFGTGAPSTAKLQLNGNSITIGALSTNATPGTPVIENGHASTNATLTVSQTANTTYAGSIQNGGAASLGLIKSGSGTLGLDGANTYTGTTAVNSGTLLVNGNSSSATGAVSVASGATLGGTGTIGGATTVVSGGRLTAGDIGTIGTLSFSGGLTLNSGSILYFDTGDFIDITGGSLSVGTGSLLRFDTSLSAGTYNLVGLNGSLPTLSDFTLQFQNGSAAPGTFSLSINSNMLVLSVANASSPIPTLTLTSPAGGSRIMANTAFNVTGSVANVGVGTLNGALSDNGGNLAVSGFTPDNPSVEAGESTSFTASANSGAALGNQTLSVAVTDPSGNPASASDNTSVSVLQDRVVSATTVADFGSVHQGATVSGTTSLTSAGADDSNTRVTVGNATADANGIAVTGGTAPTFDGSTSDTRTVSGNISTLGNVNGAITLTTTGEAGVTGTQNPVNVTVNYSASVYSGKAAWVSGSSGNWVAGGNWADTLGGGVAGSPGVDGSLSVGDTATFGDVSGSPASLTVSLNGTSPTLAGLTFNSTSTAYTIATGSGGTITLQGASTPIDVSTAQSPTISAVLAGSGLNKTGTGTLILSGANTYTGATTISNGAIQLTGGNDRLPVATSLTLGSSTNSGKLILGDSGTARNQTVTGLTTAGTGTANAVVGAAAVNSVLTVNNSTTSTYNGVLGGAGTNENNLALIKAGGGLLTLGGNNTYTGGTTLNAGTLGLGSANAIGTTGAITFANGTLQYSSANTTDYSSRFLTTGNNDYKIDTNGQNVSFANSLVASGTSGLNKSGTGTLTLAAGNTYTGATTISGGTLVTADTNTNTLKIAGGVWRPTLTGDVTLGGTLGSSTGAGQINAWTAGGFSAKGGKITVTLAGLANNTLNGDGTTLLWGNGSFMGAGGTTMIFGSASANNQVVFTNSFSLNTNDAFSRIIQVDRGTGGDSALLTGVISHGFTKGITNGVPNTDPEQAASLSGINKTGNGVLILAGNNTYLGTTLVSAGTLLVNGNTTAATGSITVNNGATFGGSGIIGGATTIGAGAFLTPGATENGRGLLTFNAGLVLNGTATLQIASAGARGTAYDAIDIAAGTFTGTGALVLNFSSVLNDADTLDLFGGAGFSGLPGLTSVTATGVYSGAFTLGGGIYSLAFGGQTLAFNATTGDLLISGVGSPIPEPATIALLAGGLALAGATLRRRRVGRVN